MSEEILKNPKEKYEAIWRKPYEKDYHKECPNCKSTKLSREFCGEYICENCGKNFGTCNLWNTAPDPFIQARKKIKSTD